VPARLASHADFDALERDVVDRAGPEALVTALTLLAEKADPATRPTDVILLVRLAMLYRDHDSRGEGWLQRALELATRLSKEAPTAPDTRFLQGYIPFAVLGGSDGRDPVLDSRDARTKQFSEACVAQWKQLAADHPDYVGPRKFTAARIRQAVANLEAATAVVPPAGLAPPPISRAVSRAELIALQELERFDSATEGQRRTLCRDWVAGRKSAPSDALIPMRVDLACATFEARPVDAVALIEALAKREGDALDPCLALARVADRAGQEATRAATQGSSLETRCATPR
jgi:hypothetical protein